MRAGPVLLALDRVDGYQLSLTDGLSSELSRAGVALLVHRFNGRESALPASLVRLLRGRRLLGAVTTPNSAHAGEEALRDLLMQTPGLPVVSLHAPPTGPQAGAVFGDNALGMRLLAEHVAGLGMRRVLAVRGLAHHRDSREREEALVAALAEHGITVGPDDVVDGRFEREASFRVVSAALARPGAAHGPDRYQVVMAFSDRSAVGALDAVRAAGLRVPEDVLITGYDDDENARLTRPALTTVSQDLVGQGALAARLLLDVAAGGPPRIVRAPVHLVIRGSTVPGGEEPEAGPAAAEGLWSRLHQLDSTIELSRSLFSARAVDELITQTAAALPRTGCPRAYLVLRVDDDAAARGWVAMAYRDGHLRDCSPSQSFDLADLLPEHLAGELDHGSLVVHPLGVAGTELGYLLLDESDGLPALLGEVLSLDLSRSLDAIRATDRLTRHAGELEALVAERTRQLQAEVATRRRAEAELLRLNAELRTSLHLDGLTGIANRVGFDETLATQWAQHSRSGRELSLLMVDVDHFKAFNDHYGHLAGDDALRAVARCLAAAVHRAGDVVARYGGEEFAVVLPNTPAAGAEVVAQRVLGLVRAAAIEHAGSPVAGRLTVSVGVAAVTPPPGAAAAELVAAADAALYEVKHSGRNAVAITRDPLAAPRA